MKITHIGKLAVSASTLLLVVILWQSDAATTCKPDTEHTTNCHTSLQQNWINWFAGKSRSTQFHFVDFLELLNRLNPSKPVSS